MRKNIHFPTDITLLLDSFRKLITLIFHLSNKHNLCGWREYKSHIKKVKKLCHKIQKSKHSTSKQPHLIEKKQNQIKESYREYIALISKNLDKVSASLPELSQQKSNNIKEQQEIAEYMNYAEKFIDQIKRRIFEGEKIPHKEKLFSIFEPDTEWISKGKSGIRQELGLNICIVTDESGFILNHKIMRKRTDSEIAIEIIRETKDKYPTFSQCSFDKGFHSPENQEILSTIIERVVLPKKGKLSASRKDVEYSEYFLKARKHHPAVESSIFALKNHGLDFCPDKGEAAFNRYVGLGILARNIQILGHKIQTEKLLMLQKQRKNLRTRALRKVS